MTRRDIHLALLAGWMLAWGWLAWEFGGAVRRMKATEAAIDSVRNCTTDDDCEAAWVRLLRVGEGR